jgi:type IX secretion system PorP/SprF family membrane protein
MRKIYTFFKILPLLFGLTGPFFFTIKPLQAQQVPYFAVFRENWVLLNPAFLNHFYLEDKNRTMMINVSHREQWFGFNGGPQQSNARIENIVVGRKKALNNVPRMKWGLGMENETLGDYASSGIFANYAYLFNISNTTFISAGLSFSFSNNRYRLDPLTFKEWGKDIPSQLLENEVRWLGKTDAGIFIKHKTQGRYSKIDHWYIGLSTIQLASLDLFSKGGGLDLVKKPHFNLLAGLMLGEPGKGGRFGTYWEPTIWIRYLPGATYQILNIKSPISTDVSVRFFVNEKIWGGGGFGTSGSVSLETGYIFNNMKKQRNILVPKIKTGILCNIPLLGTTFGYSVEAFMGIGLATY